MPRLLVPINESDHTLGSTEAAVTLVEYGDYQCERCGLFTKLLKQLFKEMGSNLRYVFRFFPLQQTHPLAMLAAQAAQAAGLQDKFWEMHELIYANQYRLSEETLLDYAKQLQLNLEQFKADFHNPSIQQKIEEDFMEGVRSGVNGTPCFYINGERYDGDSSYQAFLQALIQASK